MNPLRLDPTRTATLRRTFKRDLEVGFLWLAKKIEELVITDDVFDLTSNAVKFKFEKNKLEEFNEWLNLKIKAGVLDKEAIYKNIGAGHSQGMSRGYGDKRRLRSLLSSSGAVTAGAKQEFFSSARLKANSLQNLQARAFQDLKGITEAMAAQISQVLSDGMLTGKSKEDIALSLVDRVQKIGITRARALVETEITRAHSEGVLDALESLGDTHVSINVEWHTTDNPCELCAPLRHLILTIEQARGMFPRHVNCKCSPVPTKERSHRSKIKASIDRSVMAEVPQKKKKVRKSKLQQRRRSSWFGANK